MANLVRVGGGGNDSGKRYLIQNGVFKTQYVANNYKRNYSSYTAMTPSVSFESGVVSVSTSSNSAGTLWFLVPTDLSEYNKCVVECSLNGGTCTLQYVTSFVNNYTASETNMTSGTVSKDISSVDSAYICIYVQNGATLKISNVWLEKKQEKYLYKDGVQNVEWDNSGYSENGFLPLSAQLTENGFVIASTATNNTCLIGTEHVVDISDYSYLKAYINTQSANGGLGLEVFVNPSKKLFIDSAPTYVARMGTSSVGLTTISCDISNLQGAFYIACVARHDSGRKGIVQRVWLEK